MKNVPTSSVIVLIVFVAILAACTIGCVVLLIILRKRYLNNNQSNDIRLQQFENEIRRLKKIRNKYKNKIKQFNQIDSDKQLEDLKTITHFELLEYKQEQLTNIQKEIEEKKNELLKKTVLQTMQPLHLKVINESSVNYVPIIEKFKPLIIGKKGQNIKKLNDITSCNINVDKNTEFVEISSPNPYLRTLATNVVKHLLKSEAFDLIAIDNIYKKEKRLMQQDCIKTGKDYLTNLNISVPDAGIYEYIGRLKYRWSFSQNVLEHCYEVAIICEQLAKEFNLDSNLAKQIGFFHDLGKAVDYTKKYDHISSGIWIAKRFGLDEKIINGILKHHRTNCFEDYVLLVRCADAWSAARIGARHLPHTDDSRTEKIINDKCSKIKNILSFKAVIVNNEIQIMFIPLVNSEKEYYETKYNIIQAIKKDVRLNKHPIKFSNEMID